MTGTLRRWLQRASIAGGRAPEVVALRESNAVMGSLLAAASKITAGESSNDVVQCLCDSVVDATRHIRLAWFWYGPLASDEIRPMLAAGPAVAYARQLVIKRGLLTWRGPAYRALMTEHAAATRIFRLAPYGPWRAAIHEHALRVVMALPLRVPDPQQRGLLMFYADDRNYFRRVGLAPFEALARLSEVALAQSAARIELAAVARTDPLTRIANRRAFQEACLRQLLVSGGVAPLSLLLVDVDFFKNVNDQHGHENGDRVLVQIAQCMGDALRVSDLIGRWGGEEFVALLPGADAKIALLAAERLRAAVERLQAQLLDGRTVPLTCSVGVASSPVDATTMDRLLQVADQRLMAAKRAGRNRVHGCD